MKSHPYKNFLTFPKSLAHRIFSYLSLGRMSSETGEVMFESMCV